MNPDFIAMLRCPEDQSALTEADRALVERLNRAIAGGRICNRAGARVEREIDGALVRQDRALAYPVTDGFPVMLADEAIPLDQLE